MKIFHEQISEYLSCHNQITVILQIVGVSERYTTFDFITYALISRQHNEPFLYKEEGIEGKMLMVKSECLKSFQQQAFVRREDTNHESSQSSLTQIRFLSDGHTTMENSPSAWSADRRDTDWFDSPCKEIYWRGLLWVAQETVVWCTSEARW